MKKLFFTFLFAALIVAPSISQQNSALQKFALVIGNANYGLTRLVSPVNDANDMEAALKGLGFTVEKVTNGNLSQMERAVNNFKQRLGASRNSIGFFFYAGHGAQSGGENYLLPANVSITNENQLRQRAFSVRSLLEGLSAAGNGFNMIVLDACRENSFSWSRNNRGLAAASGVPAGSMIMYSAGANSVAAEVSGRNSLFTGQLLNNLKTPGLNIQNVLGKTGEDVIRVSNGRQHPELLNRYSGTAAQPVPLPAPTPTPAIPAQPATTPAQTTTTPVQTVTVPSTPAANPSAGNMAGRADPDAANWNIAALDTAANADYLSPIEKDIILEMNKVRSNPKKYAELYIQPMTRYFNGRNYSVPGKITLVTQEGVAAVNDCVSALNRASSAGSLAAEKGLSLAAKDHVADQSRTGRTGHDGSDRSMPDARMRRYGTFSGSWTWGENIAYGESSGRDIVCGLLVDDGVSDRGHRANIMNRAFTQAGVGYGTHTQYRTSCTIDYANGYRSN